MIAPQSRYGLLQVPKYLDIRTNAQWIGNRQPVLLSPADDDHFLVTRAGERPDQIAMRVPGWQMTFGDDAADLWWIILDQPDNGCINPFALPAGVTFRCPSADRVVDALSR